MNQAILRGRLTTDPKVSTSTTDGKEYTTATFTLAVPDRSHRNNDGTFATDFIKITAFSKTADVVSKFLSKGSEIIVTGKLHSYSYTKDESKVYRVEVIASTIEFISKCETSAPNDYSFMESVNDEELPFK